MPQLVLIDFPVILNNLCGCYIFSKFALRLTVPWGVVVFIPWSLHNTIIMLFAMCLSLCMSSASMKSHKNFALYQTQFCGIHGRKLIQFELVLTWNFSGSVAVRLPSKTSPEKVIRLLTLTVNLLWKKFLSGARTTCSTRMRAIMGRICCSGRQEFDFSLLSLLTWTWQQHNVGPWIWEMRKPDMTDQPQMVCGQL